jgi:hypothetical protein
VTERGLESLSAFKHSARLRSLRLELRSIGATSAGIRALVEPLSESHTIEKLHLDLSNNNFLLAGIAALGLVYRMPLLSDLHLDLNLMIYELDGECIEELSAIGNATRLRTIHLNLGHNRIGDRGAGALGRLNAAPALETLDLVLNDNRIGDTGAWELAKLKDAPMLRTLRLELQNNQITKRGAIALVHFYAGPGADKYASHERSLFLNLEGNDFSSTECNCALDGLRNTADLNFKFKC